MKRIHEITTAERLAQFEAAPGLPTFDASDLESHSAGAHLVLAEGASCEARCSLWWQGTPSHAGRRSGIIGHFAARSEADAALLLEHACKYLQARGCQEAIGPMDGSTWRSYRLVTQGDANEGGEPPFFLEPQNPHGWPGYWEAAGFAPIASYSSQLNADLGYEDPRVARVEERLSQSGVTIRPLNLDDYESELRAVFAVSRVSFRPNFLYAPLSEEEFAAMYSRLRSYIRPELVLMAEHGARPVGFLFALPDWLQAQRGLAIDTAIIKTVAVLPGRAYAGLGNLLAARCHRIARGIGYTRAIHALMHDANHSRNVSSHYAHVLRRYALYGRTL